jgi:ornithine cyclodeaminase
VATDLLARRDASTLAILGTGIQARSHLEAMLEVRGVERVRVWSRNPDRVRAFADKEAERHAVPVDPSATAAEAVAGAGIVCTTTSARDPVLPGTLLENGMHINAVGASVPSRRELDSEAVRRSTLVTDRRESLEQEAGEYRVALEEGVIGDDHLKAELGEILICAHPGRTSDDEITLFRSLGLAVEDMAAGRLVYERALARGVGTRVDLGG